MQMGKHITSRLKIQKITIPTIAPAGTVECVCVWGGGGGGGGGTCTYSSQLLEGVKKMNVDRESGSTRADLQVLALSLCAFAPTSRGSRNARDTTCLIINTAYSLVWMN